jgi:hypothetical protein
MAAHAKNDEQFVALTAGLSSELARETNENSSPAREPDEPVTAIDLRVVQLKRKARAPSVPSPSCNVQYPVTYGVLCTETSGGFSKFQHVVHVNIFSRLTLLDSLQL